MIDRDDERGSGGIIGRLRNLLRRRPVAAFLALAYLWSWAWWSIILLGLWLGELEWASARWRGVPYWMIGAAIVGSWGPTLAALLVTASTEGQAGVRTLLRRCLMWRRATRWHLAAWFLPPLMVLASLLLFRALGSQVGPFLPARWPLALLVLALSLPAGPLGEELGWRGFLLPRMQRSMSALWSSLVIGVLWCFWHTPIFWAPMGATMSGTAVTLWAVFKYLVYVVGLSVIFTWLFNSTGGSLLFVIVLHLAVNADLVTPFFPHLKSADIRFIVELSTIPIWLVALAIIARCGPSRLSCASK